MEDINKGARPDIAPYLHIEVADFKVTDPTAPDPNAPVRMLYAGKPFKITLTLGVTGYFTPVFTGKDELWATDFYADSLGVDVAGERKWHPAPAALPAISGNTYEISYTVQAGLTTPGIYEFGAITRLPKLGVNAYVEGYHVEVAEF